MTLTRQPLGTRAQGFDRKQVIVSAIDAANKVAVCTDRFGSTLNIRTDVLRAKGSAPEVGEQWLVDRQFDGWTFALCLTAKPGDTGSTPSPKRVQTTYVSQPLEAGEGETGTVALATGYRVLRIRTDTPSRVRLYCSVADQVADIDRDTTTPPDPGLGIVMDYLTADALLEAPLSPVAEGANFDTPVARDIPISVTSVAGGPVVVTLTWVATE